jgi:hypothetical protein
MDNSIQIGDFNFEEPTVVNAAVPTASTHLEISDEERDNLATLMARLGL